MGESNTLFLFPRLPPPLSAALREHHGDIPVDRPFDRAALLT